MVLHAPLAPRTHSLFDEVFTSLLGSFGRQLNIHTVWAIEAQLAILGSYFRSLVINLFVRHVRSSEPIYVWFLRAANVCESTPKLLNV
jgi:hypothetical protein